ncbi:MAG TPA: YdeI/OmpD-associated family protein [Croceibacterium sp.]|nr:YdeI/OmpD-associated family protein [Croceibacterium sp.]
MTAPIRFRTRLRQHPGMGPWFRIPARFIREWGLTATTTVEGTINGHPLGRRAIKDSGPKTDDWYMGLTKDVALAIDGKGGDEVDIELRLADMTMPAEMAERMASDAEFARAYGALSPNHRRKAIEHYLEAKTAAGRTARLEKISRSIKARLAGKGK